MPDIIFKRILFEQAALDYPLGRQVLKRCREAGLEVSVLKGSRVSGIPGQTPRESFFQGKATLVVGVRREMDYATCKPSAHFQLPLVSGCPGMCEYCYLQTQMGKRPYTRAYVNIEEILAQAGQLIEQRLPAVTVFEAAATSDPLPVESLSGALSRAIQYFASQPQGRLRFVTKYPLVQSLLRLNHAGHTRIRFSINTPSVVNRFEHRTPPVKQRIYALKEVMDHGYPAGVIIAPVILEPGWEDDYRMLIDDLRMAGLPEASLNFEIISHRFTTRAKNRILEVFPESTLPMDESGPRQYRFGQFGYGKYVYDKESLAAMKAFFAKEIAELFPGAVIEYII